MVNNIEKNVNDHIKDNFWLYFCSIACIFIGMLFGVYYVKYMGQADKSNLYEYLSRFIQNIENTDIECKNIFIQAMKNTIPIIIAMWFLGLTVIGIPMILLVDILKGFTLGFSISSLISSLGSKGIWISILGLIPQNIIYIPCIVFISVVSIQFSLSIIRDRIKKQWTTNVASRILSYSAIFIIITLLCFLGFLIEGYFTPQIMKLLA